jgi:hypothetical protein
MELTIATPVIHSRIPMNRRDFLKRLGLVTAGVVAADQLEIIERLGWKRRFFPGFTPAPKFVHKSFALGFTISQEMIEDDIYLMDHETFVKAATAMGLLHGHILSSAGKVDHLVLPREPGLISQGVMGGTHNPMPILRPAGQRW